MTIDHVIGVLRENIALLDEMLGDAKSETTRLWISQASHYLESVERDCGKSLEDKSLEKFELLEGI